MLLLFTQFPFSSKDLLTKREHKEQNTRATRKPHTHGVSMEPSTAQAVSWKHVFFFVFHVFLQTVITVECKLIGFIYLSVLSLG